MDTDNKFNTSQDDNQIRSSEPGFIKRFTLTPKQRKLWQVVIGLFLVFVLAAGIYAVGYKNGYRVKKKPVATNPTIPRSVESPFNIVVGKIAEISEGKVLFYSADGKKMDVKVTGQTKITSKEDTLSVNDLKKDQRVQVLLKDKDAKEPEATRIILRN